jgi:oxygen-dependent protoporphyrinogen oxidase
MRVGVIGGGISGLTAAYQLRKAGADVELFEGSARLGGLLGTEIVDGCVVETGPDSILTDKPWALELARELGLEGRIVRTRESPRGAYIVRGGRLERIPEGFSMMAPTDLRAMWRSPVLSTRGKLRMGLDLVLPRGSEEDESLESFVVRRLGREGFERLAQPMVGGIYGADPKKLSLRATMPRFVEMEREYRSVIRGLIAKQRSAGARAGAASGARYGMFIAFEGGMQDLVDALARRLEGCIQTRSLVTAIERDREGLSIEVHGAWHAYDALVVALPAHIAAQTLHTFDRELAEQLFGIEYASAATVTCLWPRNAIAHPLDAFGFVVPAVEDCALLASTWASVKYPGRAPDDLALIRVFLGGYKGQHLLDRSDAELENIARRELEKLIGVRAAPRWTRTLRYMRAMPQYHVGHLARVARIEELAGRHARFALAGNAYRGVGIPDAIRSGTVAAQRVLS